MAIKKITRDTLISDLEISVRLQKCLFNMYAEQHGKSYDPCRPTQNLGLPPHKVKDFAFLTDAELLRCPNLGRKSLREWKDIVWAVENPDSPIMEENIAEYEALKEIRATINRIAATHNSLATYYKKLADVIPPLI